MSTIQNSRTHLAKMNVAVPLRNVTEVFGRWWVRLWERLRTYVQHFQQPRRLPPMPEPGELDEVPAVEVGAVDPAPEPVDPHKGTIHETLKTEVTDMAPLLMQLHALTTQRETSPIGPDDMVATVVVPRSTKQVRISPSYYKGMRTIRRILYWRKTGPGMIMPWEKMEMIPVRPGDHGDVYPISFPIEKLGLKEGDSAEFAVVHDTSHCLMRLSVEFLFI